MEMNDNKRIKANIWVGYVVNAKVGEMEDKKRHLRSMRTRKEVVGNLQDVVGKKKFLVKFEYGKKKEMSSVLISYVCSKEEV